MRGFGHCPCQPQNYHLVSPHYLGFEVGDGKRAVRSGCWMWDKCCTRKGVSYPQWRDWTIQTISSAEPLLAHLEECLALCYSALKRSETSRQATALEPRPSSTPNPTGNVAADKLDIAAIKSANEA